MTTYQYQPRKKDERGIYAILPAAAWGPNFQIDYSMELGRVKARTPSEALKLAGERGIIAGHGGMAVEMLPDSRVTVIEEPGR